MATTHEIAAKAECERNKNFPILFFTFLLLLLREIVLEREPTMTDEEHFFLPTSRSRYPCTQPRTSGPTDGRINEPTDGHTLLKSRFVAITNEI